MRTLAFDGRTGAAGDMILGALLAAGADPDALAPVKDALPVRYAVDETTRDGIAATTVDVRLTETEPGAGAGSADGDRGPDGERGANHDHGHGHGDDKSHEGGDDKSHEHGHDHTHAEGSGPTRTYAEVIQIVETMALPAGVEQDALAIFKRLGEAEAAVHGTDLEGTAFHEVGADDAIADVVGACLLIADLAVDRVVTTPPAAGGGEVDTSHGRYPVPVPAVTEIAAAADWSLRGGPVDRELLTPTGAAILAELATGVDALPTLRIAASGYGAGGIRLPDRPNVLRALVGEGKGLRREGITMLETNLDDATPETLGGLRESLAAVGALDVSVLPATMKKSRPGHLVKVLCRPEDARRVARRLAEETGTLGVRAGAADHRFVADRAFETAQLMISGETHEVAVKIASTADGAVYDVSAEYDDAAAVAEATGLPTREVIRRAEAAVDVAAGASKRED